jgi:thiamine-phosphate pyrophosphorylase
MADESLRRTQATVLRNLCRNGGAKLIINDHVDLAVETDADGVHVGADDAAVRSARARLGSGKLVGASCYNSLQGALTAAEQGADYVAFGSFFASAVKPGAVRAPVALLREVKQKIKLPVVAIGGITLSNARELIEAGADAIAVISALFSAPDVETTTRDFCRLFPVEP